MKRRRLGVASPTSHSNSIVGSMSSFLRQAFSRRNHQRWHRRKKKSKSKIEFHQQAFSSHSNSIVESMSSFLRQAFSRRNHQRWHRRKKSQNQK
ncbi:predicted protein [Arabidopsis lyrata subsp. lyrata]|uniref:Predicted protein n=1 Tax=Arabidopsis lyrata subsp. lyrata TaxID=81972 RepID=D7KVF3_ARALL|nr:predicted protein [Arabidopsis lyrata subsp. lyrata]